MAITNERKRIMPTAQDRAMGQELDYPEAVLLDSSGWMIKYQYSIENKDNKVHGWINPNPKIGLWMITPSNEFKTGGPVKKDLTSHTGPITLSMFFSTHYAREILTLRFRNGEPWKKMLIETENWPYDFRFSKDFVLADQRGTVSGRLLIHVNFGGVDTRDVWSVYLKSPENRLAYLGNHFGISCNYFRNLEGVLYLSKTLVTPNSTFIGLAAPGDVGSWQIENKVPGFIGDYKYKDCIYINPGSRTRLYTLVFNPPRSGPTLWEIGIPDRTAAEFFIPNPQPKFEDQFTLHIIKKIFLSRGFIGNNLSTSFEEYTGYIVVTNKSLFEGAGLLVICTALTLPRFRQYGLWDCYTEIYTNGDLVYTIGSSNYQTDWFFAHVNRYTYNDDGNKTYIPTTWKILFDLQQVKDSSNYTLQLALASANDAELQIRINDQYADVPHFSTGSIGRDNMIARHGIHGLYRMYTVDIPSNFLASGTNVIILKQSRGSSHWSGVMYDYIRLERPPSND
ncbi:hypothetical protein P3S68_030506 [Capsicum galapagoense]